MAVTNIVTTVPPSVVELIQQGALERAFHDGLFPAMLFRAECQEEEWVANTGTEIFMSRPGLLAPVTTAIAAGQDPQPQTVNYEQWVARLARYGGTIDTQSFSNAARFSNVPSLNKSLLLLTSITHVRYRDAMTCRAGGTESPDPQESRLS